MVVLCLFCLELLVCVALDWPIVAALLVGLVLFVGWALRQGYGLRAVGGMLWSGIRTAKNVLIVFLLIVVLAPLVPWSIAGAVPLASAGAPEQSLLAACYLYLIPLCSLVWKLLRRRRVAA